MYLMVVALCASSAGAQPTGLPGFELERLVLNPNGLGSLVVGTGQMLPKGSLRSSVVLHYEKDPLVYYQQGSRVGAVVGHRLTANLMAAWAPLEWLELEAQLPVVLSGRGEDLSGRGVGRPEGAGLSTPVLGARVGLLAQRKRAPVDLALGFGAGLPLGSAAVLGRDEQVRLSPRVMMGRSFGGLRAGVDVGLLLRPTLGLSDELNVADEVGDEVHLGAVLATTGQGLRGELSARAQLPLTRQASSLELLAGARLPVARRFEAYALAGPGFGEAPGTPSFRVLMGMSYVPGQKHVKGTDVKVADVQGAGMQGADVEGTGMTDTDVKDTAVTDAVVTNTDVADAVVTDTDGDGVADHLDNCRIESGPASNQGCPEREKQLVTLTQDRIQINGTVHFETGRALIQPRSFPLLDQVAKVLREHPDIQRVRIEGHSDSRGSAALNRRLSKERAESVRAYLVKQGVEASRLAAEGYGPDRPVASNDSAEGRASNRRVEFLITSLESEQP
jgi:outer membrane protein OmpA-like peptidoglycan-associated protein